jgi:NodT family efflux transporter outer membrane factor (OMF) lipoprotein
MTPFRFHAKRLAVAAMLAALSACTVVGPNYHLPEESVAKRGDAATAFMGSAEKSFRSDPLPPDWWRLYRDPTLDALIAKAFAANADLRAAVANLERTHGVLEEVEERKKPEVEMSASPSYGRLAGAALARPDTLPNFGFYSTDIRVGYEVDFVGKVRRAIEAAEADIEAAEAAADLTHVMVAADTTRAYADACSAGHEIKVAQRLIDLQQKFVELTAERVKLGRGTALDNTRANSQLETVRASLPPLEALRRNALYRLAVLTGDVPNRFPAEVAECERPPRVTTTIPVGDGAALLRRRPDIRQTERVLAAATARIGVATAELYPSINFGLTAGSIGTLQDIGASNTFHFNIGPLISWNLPATSSARSHIAQTTAVTKQSLARFDATVLNALREAESALTNYARELDRNAALKAAVDQSTLASQQAATLQRYGRSDFFTSLEAERTMANAQTALAASDAALAVHQVTLFLALGGGWENTHAEHGGQTAPAGHKEQKEHKAEGGAHHK